ncbi:MAG: YihY/virulence factor BrkB family protein [bacterium]|nr:YihY/virulence factor BrkB family protein [bacterium]
MVERFNIKKWFWKLPPVRRVVIFLDNIYPPGFQGASLFSVFQFFFKGIISPKFNLYAGSLSWNFFLAIFPSLIFLFTLIAYLPINGLQKAIMEQIDLVLPKDSYKVIKLTITDIVKHKRSGLLSVGFLSALYFASNGVFSMMLAFDSNFNEEEKKKRNFFQKRGMSILLSLYITTLIFLSMGVLITSSLSSNYIIKHHWLNKSVMLFIVSVVQFITLSALVFFIMSSLYYFGHSAKKKWRFFSPGATVATVLSIVATYLFTSYVDGFNSYNKLYGSIGAIIVMMLLIYFNTLCVLVGFELNKSIETVVKITQVKRKQENRFLN